jgi:hypothetical protein
MPLGLLHRYPPA